MSEDTNTVKTYCGFIAIVGRPNVGKSTLLNQLLGKKLSITSPKPQTTRHQILGIKTIEDKQYIYVDTPGLHKHKGKAINRYMNRVVLSAIQDVDVIVFVTDANHWTDEDDMVLQQLKLLQVPVIAVMNKIDLIKDKAELLPLIEKLSAKMQFAAIVPLSALKGKQIEGLEAQISQFLPPCIHYFKDDQFTDKNEQFLASEIIREKLMRALGEELPYAVSVVIEKYEALPNLIKIAGLIYVEREGQKAIVIGKSGEMLKKIGKNARLDMEALFGKKVFLELWVKVKAGWGDSEQRLKNLGYTLD